MNPHEIFCPNIACPARGQTGKGNIAVHSQKEKRYICEVCQATFTTTKGTLFSRLRTAPETVILVIVLLANGCPIQAIVKAFGFDDPNLTPALFLQMPKIIRMGFPPMRLEISTSISGVEFDECYQSKIVAKLDDVEVNIIDLENLKKNKKASGRAKDIADLEELS